MSSRLPLTWKRSNGPQIDLKLKLRAIQLYGDGKVCVSLRSTQKDGTTSANGYDTTREKCTPRQTWILYEACERVCVRARNATQRDYPVDRLCLWSSTYLTIRTR